MTTIGVRLFENLENSMFKSFKSGNHTTLCVTLIFFLEIKESDTLLVMLFVPLLVCYIRTMYWYLQSDNTICGIKLPYGENLSTLDSSKQDISSGPKGFRFRGVPLYC